MTILHAELSRPLTLEDLRNAKAEILEELQALGILAAERLREHLAQANRLRPERGARRRAAQPRSAASTTAPKIGPSEPPPPAVAPRLDREGLETLFHNQCAHQLAADARLPSRWECELERRLQAHTPTPSATPFHSTGASSTPLSSCPASPLTSQPWRRRSRLGAAEGPTFTHPGLGSAAASAPAAATSTPGHVGAPASVAPADSVPSDCRSAQSLYGSSNPDSCDTSRGGSSGGGTAHVASYGGDSSGSYRTIGATPAAAVAPSTARRPPRPRSAVPCDLRQDAAYPDLGLGQTTGSPLALSPGQFVFSGAESPVDGTGQLTVARPQRSVAPPAVASRSASPGAGAGGVSCASSSRSSPEPGIRRELPSQLVEEIVRQLFIASCGGAYPAAAAAVAAATATGGTNTTNGTGAADASDLLVGYEDGVVGVDGDCGLGAGAALHAAAIRDSGDRTVSWGPRSRLHQGTRPVGAAAVAVDAATHGLVPAARSAAPGGTERACSSSGEGPDSGLILRESWTDPAPDLQPVFAVQHSSGREAMEPAMAAVAAAASLRPGRSGTVAAKTAPLTPVRTPRACVTAASPAPSASPSAPSCRPALGLAAISGCSSCGVASPGDSGSGTAATSLTPSYLAASPYTSTPPSSRSASGLPASYAQSPVLRRSGVDMSGVSEL